MYFEGKLNHQSLRNTGTFRAVGQILTPSFLHSGPCIHGLSKAVMHYIASEKKKARSIIGFSSFVTTRCYRL